MKVDEEVRLEKKKAKNKGLVAAGLLGAPDDAVPSGEGASDEQEASGQDQRDVRQRGRARHRVHG